MTGKPTLAAETEITSIQRTGFWMMIAEREYFVNFEDHPDFENAPVAQLHHFRRTQEGIHWDGLDIDIEIGALTHPENYPLTFNRKPQ